MQVWDSIEEFGGAVDDLQSAVAAGWAVDEDRGQTLLKAANDLYDRLDGHLQRADFLTQELPLGTTPAAQVYKPYLATIATDPHQGLIVALKELQRKTADIRTSIEKSMAAYDAAEQNSRQGINKANRA
ncbi:hypothetical protein [Lentzea aerocolonigenes]|uniref:hypothetical protein n=1 Tax=Lentzea aerocolonigenes TaxID=68170 RepID=UPI000AB7200F|nr:hypothetical protein [Lentzea aerocolonigenes]